MNSRDLTVFRSAKASAVLASALTLLALSIPASAEAYLYWQGSRGIARASLNGTGIDASFVASVRGSVLGLAVSTQYIYFGGPGGAIGRANLDGSNADLTFINIPQPVPENPSRPTEEDADFLAISGAHIYWADPGDSYISRAGIDGADIELGFIKTESDVSGIAIDGGHLYWASEHAIGRANLERTDVEPNFIPLSASGANGVAVADGYIYWSAHWGHNIGRAHINGRSVNPDFIVGLGYVSDATVGGQYLYWQAKEALSAPTRVWIGRAQLNGRHVQRYLINVTNTKYGSLAADARGPSGKPGKHARPRQKHQR